MATALKSVTPIAREIPHTVSPGLWALAWKRLKSDHVGMVSLAIVAAFIVLMILSGTGLVARDWNREIGVNYAPPSFIGADMEAGAPAAPEAAPTPPIPASEYKSSVVDPLADVLAEIKGEKAAPAGTPAVPAASDEGKTVDPLADVMADIRAGTKGAKGEVTEARAGTLLFGGDKWGRDVIKKTIKGSETSIFVGLASAAVAVFIGTVMGALAGYYGKWVDDFFNWFYSIFSAIPYLLLILAVAAVLQQKGMLTIILILGLTGWTGVFRLIRGEYLKHKAREYVQAADAIGASNARRMFVHIFPNVSHVVLVQLSILTVGFIKAEVILSFLGFGVPVDVVSWGSMLNEAQNELILGKWWQLVAATVAMATLVTAFSLFTDALRDALDPKLKGRMGA
jgi:peptide/nickel transport system permease protein